MSGTLIEDISAKLQEAYNNRDRTKYYEIIRDSGDPYGDLALGVVKQSMISGRVAKNFAVEVGRRTGTVVDARVWLAISELLMTADFTARQQLGSGQNQLAWTTIRDYHIQTFESQGLPGEAWTAFIPLTVVGDGQAPGLWHRMCRRDMIRVGIETMVQLLSPVVERETGEFPAWAWSIPHSEVLLPSIGVGSAALSMELGGCMKSVQTLKACRNQLTPTEQQALFWLDVLFTDIHGAARDTFIIPTSIWRSL